jgi:PncC family amidohydrolase
MDYKSKYLKYKNKYLRNLMIGGVREPQFDEMFNHSNFLGDTDIVKKARLEATEEGYKLLVNLNKKNDLNNYSDKNISFQIATAESLTAGLIFSTLVDIPWGGFLKYGGFSVYDTDAKRKLLGVTIDNVYQLDCAKELALGVLNNSNATIAIAVSGNAMPTSAETANMLGEVYFAIAGYSSDNNIIYTTEIVNICNIYNITECNPWVETLAIKKEYPERNTTTIINKAVRYYTALHAYKLCNQFIYENDIIIPGFKIANKKNAITYKTVNKNVIINEARIQTCKSTYAGACKKGL